MPLSQNGTSATSPLCAARRTQGLHRNARSTLILSTHKHEGEWGIRFDRLLMDELERGIRDGNPPSPSVATTDTGSSLTTDTGHTKAKGASETAAATPLRLFDGVRIALFAFSRAIAAADDRKYLRLRSTIFWPFMSILRLNNTKGVCASSSSCRLSVSSVNC